MDCAISNRVTAAGVGPCAGKSSNVIAICWPHASCAARANKAAGTNFSRTRAIMRWNMVAASQYISNSTAATVGAKSAFAALLILCSSTSLVLAAGTSSDITLSPNAVISADGERSVWAKQDGSGFWVAERSTPSGVWAKPTEIAIRGVARNPVFSPDGKKFAFENARGGYSTQDPNVWGPTRAYSWSFIAVFNFIDGRLSYVNPSFAQDCDPHWSNNDTISFTRRIEGQQDISLTAAIAGTAAQTRTGAAATNFGVLEALLAVPLAFQPVSAGDG